MAPQIAVRLEMILCSGRAELSGALCDLILGWSVTSQDGRVGKVAETLCKLEELATLQVGLIAPATNRGGLRIFGAALQIVRGIDLCVQPHLGIQNEILGEAKSNFQRLFPPLVRCFLVG